MNIMHHPPSPPIYTSLSSLRLFSLWLFKVSFHSLVLFIRPHSLSLSVSPQHNRPFLAESDLFKLQPQFCSHLSTFPSLFIPFLPFSTHLSVYMSALSPFCQLILVIYSIKIPLYSFSGCVSPLSTRVPSVFSVASSLPFSLRRQTKPESKFIIYQVALKFMVLKG